MERGPTRRVTRSVFRTILVPLLVLMLAQVLLLTGSIHASGVVSRLERNAEAILNKQVTNRKNYLEQRMVSGWSDLTMLSASINASTQQMLDDGSIALEELDSNSAACAPLLLNIADELISTLYSKQVSGIYVLFNTHDLNVERERGYPSKTGIYLRDLDPSAAPSSRNDDLLLVRAPIDVVRGLNIATDAAWHPLFDFGTGSQLDYYEFLSEPFQTAYEAQEVGDPADYGYWSGEPFQLQGTTQPAISYSIPLILPDGTVYGVLGIDLLSEYLRSMLPNEELFDDELGSYLLAVEQEEPLSFSVALASGAILRQAGEPDTLELEERKMGGYSFEHAGQTFYADAAFLPLYSSNAPGKVQRWALIGAVEEERFYAFPRQTNSLLLLIVSVTLISGLIGSLLISRRLSNPISGLAAVVDRVRPGAREIPQLPATGIVEIDRFSRAITDLSRDVLDSSTRFLRIMEMASVEMGGFEIREEEEFVFVTDNFFPLFGQEDVSAPHIERGAFHAMMQTFEHELNPVPQKDGSRLFCVPTAEEKVRYLRVEVARDGLRQVGLVEDVTEATFDRMRIEHERDYDLLTGLYNRRAFYRSLDEIFQSPERLGHTALVMLDLDYLKRVNDRYGHDWGDRFIQQAGHCFATAMPDGNVLVSRVSGDEFLFCIYGYPSREAARAVIAQLADAVRQSVFVLPDGESLRIGATGGIAWYPEDSTDAGELVRFADFAMYQVKRSHRGQFGDFDLTVYNRESYLAQTRREFLQLLEQDRLAYHFQPIVDAKTGDAVAFEALMRVDMPTLRSPETVLQLARQEGRLRDIERMTWFHACAAYESLLVRKLVPADTLLFVNSIASQTLTSGECATLAQRYSFLDRIVTEITESEDMDAQATLSKREFSCFSGLFALDDYGSGYNGEKNLLELSPQYIKVDISIIRGIDSDTSKQQIVTNIVNYAHPRGMKIIAEGLENAGEVAAVLRLNVDLLQGYFLARPAAIPPATNPEAVELIRLFYEAQLV